MTRLCRRILEDQLMSIKRNLDMYQDNIDTCERNLITYLWGREAVQNDIDDLETALKMLGEEEA